MTISTAVPISEIAKEPRHPSLLLKKSTGSRPLVGKSPTWIQHGEAARLCRGFGRRCAVALDVRF